MVHRDRAGSSRPISCRRRPLRPSASAAASPEPPSASTRPVTGGLPRTARGAVGGGRKRPLSRHRPRSCRIAARVFAGHRRASKRSPAFSSRQQAHTPRPSNRTWPSSRRSARPGSLPSSGSGPWCPDDLPFIADAKRGDIGSTAARQAVALFDRLGADAITVNPYLGSEAIAPLLERTDRFAYVLCRTSNPGAAELQGLIVVGRSAERGAQRAPPPSRRAPCDDLGTRRDGRPRRRRDRAVARSRRSGRSRPVSPSSCQASARRAETSRQSWPMDRRARVPAGERPGRGLARERVARDRRRSRGGRRRRTFPGPRRTSRRSCPRMGRQAPCATLAAPDGPGDSSRRGGPILTNSLPTGAPRCCRISEPQSSSSSW